MRICFATPNTLGYPDGGHLWVFLNWAIGLTRLGHEVIWLDLARPDESFEILAAQLQKLRARLAVHGLDRNVALCTPAGTACAFEKDLALRSMQEALSCDLLCNHRYDLPQSVIRRFKYSMLIDIDPGQLQTSFDMGTYRFVPHTSYFTVGEWPSFLGTTPVPFNTHGVTWHYIPPPVDLPSWPTRSAGDGAAFTTVSNWYMSDEWMPEPGDPTRFYDNSKRTAFEPYVDLPQITGVPLELAINIGDYQPEIDRLSGFGWRVRKSDDVSDPEVYRNYIQQSLGEFSSAKASYVRMKTGWLSDRTASYLASGKPAVVLKTGESRIFPDREGLLRFTDKASAVDCLKEVVRNYDFHCKAARNLAETHLDAQKVLSRALEIAVS